MNRKRWNDDQLIEAVKTYNSIAKVLQSIGLKATGANYKTVHFAVNRLRLDTSHWLGMGYLRGKTHNYNPPQLLTEIMVVNSLYTSTNRLKKRMIQEGLLANECSICCIKEWCNKPIVLQLDHVNGINNDNRLENLRLLCPNCHSQTETYAGKNKGKFSR